MIQNNDELRARLLAENDEFRKLHDEHRGCDERLHEFSRKAFLSGDEQIEERKLKKQKLLLKDRMESMKTRYQSELAGT